MNFTDYINTPNVISSIIALIMGFLGGYISNRSLQNRQRQYSYICKQLDNLYGPLYAQIISYEINRNMVNTIIKRDFHTENDLNFSVISESASEDDNNKKMMVRYAKNSFKNFKKIQQIIISNISCARKKDMMVIEILFKKYYYHDSAYGHEESPDIFSNYLESTKLTDEFLTAMKNSYNFLIEKHYNPLCGLIP